MKTVAGIFAFIIILSSPLHAFMKPSAGYTEENLQQSILLKQTETESAKITQSETSKPIVVIMGDTGEIYFLFSNHLFSLQKNDEEILPLNNPLQKNLY